MTYFNKRGNSHVSHNQNQANVTIMQNKTSLSKLSEVNPKAPCKQTQHCWPTTPNIVGYYMLCLFALPVACCCAKFETGQTFQPTTANISFVP